jgi:hypothetical protein
MRKQFPGHFKICDEVLKEIWLNGRIVFDTNVLLDVFRIPIEQKNKLLEVMTSLSSQLWLPHQIALEFLQQKDAEIESQISVDNASENNVHKACQAALNTLSIYKSHQWINYAALEKIINHAESEIKGEIKSRYKETFADNGSKFSSYRQNCEKLTAAIADLYEGKTGEPYISSVYEQKVQQALARIDENIPPGFGDIGKKGASKAGDVMLWFQMIDYAKEQQKPILFVTRDTNKSDWFMKSRGGNVQPLPQLINEFMGSTGQYFYAYQYANLFEALKRFKNINIEPALKNALKTIEQDEVRKISTFPMFGFNPILMSRFTNVESQRQVLDELSSNPATPPDIRQMTYQLQRHPVMAQSVNDYVDSVRAEVNRVNRCISSIRHRLSELCQGSAPLLEDGDPDSQLRSLEKLGLLNSDECAEVASVLSALETIRLTGDFENTEGIFARAVSLRDELIRRKRQSLSNISSI